MGNYESVSVQNYIDESISEIVQSYNYDDSSSVSNTVLNSNTLTLERINLMSNCGEGSGGSIKIGSVSQNIDLTVSNQISSSQQSSMQVAIETLIDQALSENLVYKGGDLDVTTIANQIDNSKSLITSEIESTWESVVDNMFQNSNSVVFRDVCTGGKDIVIKDVSQVIDAIVTTSVLRSVQNALNSEDVGDFLQKSELDVESESTGFWAQLQKNLAFIVTIVIVVAFLIIFYKYIWPLIQKSRARNVKPEKRVQNVP